MHTLELDLPKHLYTETTDSDGNVIDITYAADKLVSWAEYGGGKAIDNWYQERIDSEIAAIDAWEDKRYMTLEEQWLEQENGSDDNAAESNYETACQAIADAANSKRETVLTRMQQRREAIDKLIVQSREYIAAHQPAEPADYTFGFLLAVGAIITLAYLLVH